MAESPSAPPRLLGRRSGLGLVLANMVGAGVFLSTGFMAQDMGPVPILLAWLAGAALALAGAWAYAELAVVVPRSGGEYRYLGHFLHPGLGYLAGWGSLVLGFAAPVAVDGIAAGAFLSAVGWPFPPAWSAAALVLLLAGFHAVSTHHSVWAQNALVGLKAALVVGFVVLGLTFGRHEWPTWVPPGGVAGEFPWRSFFANQVWIAFAFSGWNAAVYVSGEFREPRRDVPWVVMAGAGSVAVLYLLVNWVFVANLTPGQAATVMQYETQRITLGHLVMSGLLGPAGGAAMSLLAAAALVSASSAMLLVGPRVLSAMAHDGVLPRWLAAREGEPPRAALLVQAGLSVAMVFTQQLRDLVSAASGALLLFSSLTVLSLFRVRRVEPSSPPPSRTALVAAALFAACSGALFLQQLLESAFNARVMAVLGLVAATAWWFTGRAPRAAPVTAPASLPPP